jgi:hypothetical protein
MSKRGRARGTRSCFMTKCGHVECREAQRTYLADYYQLTKPYLGGTANVDPARAIEHIQALRDGGMGYDAIARDAGLRKNTVRYIAVGMRADGIRPDTERRILAVTRRPEWLDATGTQRRVRALAALGHSFDKIAAEVGLHHRTVSKIACGRHETVRRETAERVAHLYNAWSMTPGPSSRVRGYAIAKGWAVPLAWDDDAIDDPAARPAEASTSGRQAADLDEWLFLVRSGENPVRAAERCGVLLTTIDRFARRHGRAAEYVAALHYGEAAA